MAEQRSMDDVLASIRRIVTEEERAEGKRADPNAEPGTTPDDGEDMAPLPTAFQKPGEGWDADGGDVEPFPLTAAARGAVSPEDSEFVLTSSMRATAEDEAAAEPAPSAFAAAAGPDPVPPSEAAPDPLPDPAPDPEPAPEPESEPVTLRVEPDLADPQPEEPASEQEEPPITLDEEQLADLVRGIIREELTGNFGATLSRNIQRLVQDEVRKALARGT